MKKTGTIRVGIGGWDYAPWRKTFYPKDVPQSRALEYASRQLSAIEVNGTFYRLQKPDTYRRWRASVPDGFVFALKAPRFIVMRRVLAEAAPGIDAFVKSGIAELGDALGPLLWQFAPTKKFDAADIGRFLELLPQSAGGRELRHVLEVRHQSFLDPAFLKLVRGRGAAVVYTDSADYPELADVTAPFVYARLMRAQAKLKQGYAPQAIQAWAAHAHAWAAGGEPGGLAKVENKKARRAPRDVFVFFINGAKERAPAAAQALIRAL